MCCITEELYADSGTAYNVHFNATSPLLKVRNMFMANLACYLVILLSISVMISLMFATNWRWWGNCQYNQCDWRIPLQRLFALLIFVCCKSVMVSMSLLSCIMCSLASRIPKKLSKLSPVGKLNREIISYQTFVTINIVIIMSCNLRDDFTSIPGDIRVLQFMANIFFIATSVSYSNPSIPNFSLYQYPLSRKSV